MDVKNNRMLWFIHAGCTPIRFNIIGGQKDRVTIIPIYSISSNVIFYCLNPSTFVY